MMKCLIVLMLSFLCIHANAQEYDFSSVPRNHPRLFLEKGGEKQINRMFKDKSNRFMLEVHYHCLEVADKALAEPLCKHPGEGHILAVSRTVLNRVFNLSYAYRMTGDYRYAERAEEEMLNACDFPGWDPEHFLDTAEMMFALAIGYDWLYDFLDKRTREIISRSLLEKGLNQAEVSNFYTVSNNWNSVCNAGMVAASLAIYENIPEEAQRRIKLSVESNPKIQVCYAPDGAYPEGYSYWNYGTTYEVALIQMLRDNLGNDFGLADYTGFMDSGWFVPFMMTPTWHTFSYSDSGDSTTINPILTWFSLNTGDSSLLYLEKRHIQTGKLSYGIEERYLPLMLVYASRQNLTDLAAPKKNFYLTYGASDNPRGSLGVGNVPMFVYRSGWDSENDTYLAVKGGQPNFSHGHMDIGEFYFEKDGVIWAKDLGSQSYGTFYKNNIKCWDFSQNGDRWGIWRYCTLTHNTITVNGGRQNASSFSPIVEMWTDDDKKGCRVDMTPALSLQLESASREVCLNGDDSVLTIVDSLVTREVSEVYWNMTTMADAVISGPDSITLSKGRKAMVLKVVSPACVRMSILSTKSPFAWDVPNPGSCRVGFTVTLPAESECVLKVELQNIGQE